jgi:hypothetical protein
MKKVLEEKTATRNNDASTVGIHVGELASFLLEGLETERETGVREIWNKVEEVRE